MSEPPEPGPRIEAGAAAFERVGGLAKDNKETLNNLGSALAEFGFRHRAEAMFQRAIALYPEYEMAHKNLRRVKGGE